MRIRSLRQTGFTLIELMIAVAIIGVLATAAVAMFQNFQLRTKRSEAMSNLASIRTAQTAYFPEAGTFMEAEASPALGVPGPNPQNWPARGYFSATPGQGFDLLGWQPEGPTYFDYDTVVADEADGPAFTAAAYGDTDGNGELAIFLYMRPDTAGNTLPSGILERTLWDPRTCAPVVDSVGQVPSSSACGFPTADDF